MPKQPKDQHRSATNGKFSRGPRHYCVTWEIDIFARSPREAARKALTIQRDRTSHATVFSVQDVAKKTVTSVDTEAVETPF